MLPIRVLIIDNSIFFRRELVDHIRMRLPQGSLMESAPDPVHAKEKILLFRPTVIVANLMMAAIRLNGELFLRHVIQTSHVPVILFGKLPDGHEIAQREGAAGYIHRPQEHEAADRFYEEFANSIQQAAKNHSAASPSADADADGATHQSLAAGKILTRADWTPAKPIEKRPAPVISPPNRPLIALKTPKKPAAASMPQPAITSKIKLIAIGSSTGGTEAISTVLQGLHPPLPGIVIVQHIPPMFSRLLAERLDAECDLHVKEGESGDRVCPNTVYIAPGGKHMTISRSGGEMTLTCEPGPRVHSCCPSVDVLFDSVAKQIRDDAMGVILTGMGHDGASGLLSMRKQGSPTIGQDEATCVVYGMPRAAWEIGAVEHQFPLEQIASAITRIAHS